MKLGPFVGLLLLFLLAGCASDAMDMPDRKQLAKNNTGVLLVALTRTGDMKGQLSYTFESLPDTPFSMSRMTTPEAGELVLDATPDESDYPEITGRLITVTLPAGDYRITGWQLSHWTGSRASSKPMDIRFRVYPERYTYAGELRMMVPPAPVNDVFVRVKGAAERDIRWLQRRYADFDFNRFTVSTMQTYLPSALAEED